MIRTIEVTGGNGSKAAAPRPSPRWILAGLSLCVLMPSLATSIANVCLPTLAKAFAAPFQQVQWVVLAFLLATTTLIVGAGRLGDMVGRRRLLMAGIGLFALASLLCGLAPGLWSLIAARALQGLGAAIMLALSMALIGEAVPKARIGAAMGLLGSMSAVGTTLGPALGGMLIAAFGWRAVFLVNLPLAMAAFWLVLRSVPADRRPAQASRAGFDGVGTLLLALALGAYALAMTLGRDGFGGLNLVLLAASGSGAVLFVLVQSRAASPLLRLSILRDRGLAAGLSASMLVSTVMMATLVVGPFFLSRSLGLDAARVGLAMSAGPLVAALAGMPAGRAVDRLGARRAVLAGLGGMAIGLLALAATAARCGVAGYVAAIMVVTASYALFQVANNTAVMKDVAAEQRGVISAVLNLSRNLGLITGASAMGAVFRFASGAADVTRAQPPAAAAGMAAVFAVAAVLTLAALAISLGWRAAARPPVLAAG